MALKRLSLSLAERNVVRQLIAAPPKADVDASRSIREVRRRLDLRKLDRVIDQLAERCRDFGVSTPRDPRPTWDDLLYWQEFLDEVNEELEERLGKEREKDDKREIERLEKFQGYVSKLPEAEESWTLDDSYLKWLQEIASKKDWNKARIQDAQGGTREVETFVPGAQLEAFADFVDKVNAAIAGPSVTEENEEKKARKESKSGASEDAA